MPHVDVETTTKLAFLESLHIMRYDVNLQSSKNVVIKVFIQNMNLLLNSSSGQNLIF